jgi:hypothetical protein
VRAVSVISTKFEHLSYNATFWVLLAVMTATHH